ncbi:MAG: hypothetical protein J6Y06_03440 [Bacteroidales bacterium]|nr:hypothetical protein [Bacteroidales bacterium]
MKNLIITLAAALCLFFSCDDVSREEMLSSNGTTDSGMILQVTPESVARMLSNLPLTLAQISEVKKAVDASSANGYDEEYPFSLVFSSPGTGVGEEPGTTKAAEDPLSLGNLIRERVSGSATRSDDFIGELASSDLQIYWPYSDFWDEKSVPVITFIPSDGRESNAGFTTETLPDGSRIVKVIMVDEAYAMTHPVWVVNFNQDSGAITPQMLAKKYAPVSETRATTSSKTLRLKEFKAHRQYDPWLSGGSEFFIKIGSLKAFKADVVADLKLYNPEITDLMIKIKRGQVGKALRYNTILVSDWSEQLNESAFMLTEDDGGKMTTWKASGTVKIKSKSYGFEVELPYHRNDDIVWRGKLSSGYFQRYNGLPNRLGDVSVTFSFD